MQGQDTDLGGPGSDRAAPDATRKQQGVTRRPGLGFWTLSVLVLVAAGGLGLGLNPAHLGLFLHPTARAAVEAAGPDLSRTINVTLWFRYPLEESADYYNDHINDVDLATIRRLGYTSIRLCVAPAFIFDQDTPDHVRSSNLHFLDAAISHIQGSGLGVIVDLHDETTRFEDPANAEQLLEFWTSFSRHLSRYPASTLAMEPLNEPQFEGRHEQWVRLQNRLIAAIRAQAPRHTIIATGADWGGIEGLVELKVSADPRILYSFHFYDPHTFTHQGADWGDPAYTEISGLEYPANHSNCDDVKSRLRSQTALDLVQDYCTTAWDRVAVARSVQRAVDWGLAHHANLLVGEFGAYCKVTPRASRLQWLEDITAIFARQQLSSALWGYDDCFGLDAHRTGEVVVFDQEAARAMGLP